MLPEQIASAYQRGCPQHAWHNPARPDELAVDCHDPRQSQNERQAGTRYDTSG